MRNICLFCTSKNTPSKLDTPSKLLTDCKWSHHSYKRDQPSSCCKANTRARRAARFFRELSEWAAKTSRIMRTKLEGHGAKDVCSTRRPTSHTSGETRRWIQATFLLIVDFRHLLVIMNACVLITRLVQWYYGILTKIYKYIIIDLQEHSPRV